MYLHVFTYTRVHHPEINSVHVTEYCCCRSLLKEILQPVCKWLFSPYSGNHPTLPSKMISSGRRYVRCFANVPPLGKTFFHVLFVLVFSFLSVPSTLISLVTVMAPCSRWHLTCPACHLSTTVALSAARSRKNF